MKLNNLKYILIIAITLFISSFVFAQKSSTTAYKVRAKGLRLIVTYQGKPYTLNTNEQIDAAKVTSTKVLFAIRKDNFTYLVVDVSGQSKAKQDDRQCGAGEEANLLWIKLDSKWKIADIKSVRYESCWSSATSEDGYKINGNLLAIRISDFRNDADLKLSYDANAPEKGFKIEKMFLDKQ